MNKPPITFDFSPTFGWFLHLRASGIALDHFEWAYYANHKHSSLPLLYSSTRSYVIITFRSKDEDQIIDFASFLETAYFSS